MTRVRLALVAAALGALFAACDLNPQPLPPGDDTEDKGAGAPSSGNSSSGGGFENDPTTAPNDGADAGSDPDAGDGSTDASADAEDAG